MDPKTHRDIRCQKQWKRYEHSPMGKALGGIILVTVGATLMARQLGVVFPDWLFTWPVLLIIIGIYIGARHLFRNPGWVIMVMIGGVFLLDTIYTDINITTFFWPVFIMAAGLFMIVKPRRKHYQHHEDWTQEPSYEAENVSDDMVETVSIFGGVKKNILSKNFKGGEITCVMGGAEINLSQADIQGRVVLEVTQVLGGTKLIIPSNWDVQPEMVAVLGGIEDKRQMQQNAEATDKILVIRGTSVLGGIEIKSY